MSSIGKIFVFVTVFVSSHSIFANAETWKELLDRADSLSKAQNLDSAIASGTAALEKATEQFGETDTITAIVLHQMCFYKYEKAHYDEAESLCKRALAIRETTLEPEHPDVATTLLELAYVLREKGMFTEAEPLFERALAIREKALGQEHTDVAEPLNALAVLYWYQGDYAKAELFYRRALFIYERVMGQDDPGVSKILGNLANLYWSQGRYVEAELLYEQALVGLEKAYGLNHPVVAQSVNNMAILYWYQGKHADAEPLFKRALAIWEKTLGADHPQMANGLNNLAMLYERQGKCAEAERLYKKALGIFERVHGAEHPNVALALNNLGGTYQEQGRHLEAEPLYRQALSIYKKTYGPDHFTVAGSLNNLGNVYSDLGHYAEAESFYDQALSIWTKIYGSDHPYVAYVLQDLACLRYDQRRYAEGRLFVSQALNIFEEALGPEHLFVASQLEELTAYYRLEKNSETSLEMGERAFEIRQQNFRDNGYVLSEKDALTYSQQMRSSANNYLSCFFDAESDEAGLHRGTSDIVLASKGQVSDDIFERQKTMVNEKDSTTVALAESLRYAKFQLSQLFVSGPGDDTTGAYRRQLDSLANFANELEAGLARQSVSFRKRQDYKNVTSDRIASLLPENSVLVEYLRYDYFQLQPDSTIPHYLVDVMGGNGETVIADLGEASRIDSLVSDYRKHMLRISSQKHMPLKKDRDEYQRIAQRLYDAVVRPVESHFSGKELVFIAPDGGLNLISFAGLIDDEGKYLIEKYPIHYLASGRDLIRLKDRQTSGQGLLAIGDPDYDAAVEARLGAPGASVYAAVEEEDSYRTRNVRSGCGDLSQLRVEPLPHSRKEIERVVQQWAGMGADSAIIFFGPIASEDRFKAEAPRKRVIHLATHGYFLEGWCNPEVGHRRFELDREFVGENPLLLSGLLFAGSNLHGQGADSAGVEDGVLSAYEVSAMNLEGTDLVVLSACETGLGEVKQGEGVYGLRRAFQMAGARTVVSALWPVSDRTTADMMTQLYAHSKKSLPERIRESQLSQIKKLRSEGFSDHPYNWAPFIALGDWR